MDINMIVAIIRAFLQGMVDSFKGIITVFDIDRKRNERIARENNKRLSSNRREKHSPVKEIKGERVLTRVIQCATLNGGIFLCSLFLFDYVLLPLFSLCLSRVLGSTMATSVWSTIVPFITWSIQASWVVPLFLIAKIVNLMYFQDIANAAFESTGKTPLCTNLSKFFADSLFSLIIQFLFVLQTDIISLIPMGFVGRILNLLHMSFLYSLYAFEYRWCKLGWELHKRLMFIEKNWPYFVGFALPLAIVTSIPESYTVSGALFAILFPLFLISTNVVKPVTNIDIFQLPLFSIVINILNTVSTTTLRRMGSKRTRSSRQ